MADLTDAELAALEARYTPTIVPPCRVCGGDMGIGKIGGGEPTVWVCNHAFDNGRGKDAWDHYGKSEFVDRRRGGDHEVIALLAEVRALRAEVAALRGALGETFGSHHRCPVCGQTPHGITKQQRHADGCVVGAALAGVRAGEKA